MQISANITKLNKNVTKLISENLNKVFKLDLGKIDKSYMNNTKLTFENFREGIKDEFTEYIACGKII